MALAEMQAAVTVPVVKQTVECPSSADFFQNPGQIFMIYPAFLIKQLTRQDKFSI